MLRSALATFATAAFAAAPSRALLGLAIASSACVLPTISQKGDAGTAPAEGDAGGGASVKGASCTQVTSTISLCQFISACPTFSLNPRVFPRCGFHIHGSAIDPECLCQNQYLCPVGSPTTCTEAARAAGSDTTYDSVCQQALTGHCQDLSAAAGAGPKTSAACQACVRGCDNVPSCIDACHC